MPREQAKHKKQDGVVERNCAALCQSWKKAGKNKAPKREEDGKKTTPRFRYRGEQAKARSQEDLGSVQPLGMGPMSWMISR